VTRHYTPRQYGFTFTNGIQASYVEVDPDTGFVKLLKHWCVEDCGTVINPMLVDEQIRGGVVQGIGAALYEECLYGPDGQLLNGNMADYLVPMAGEMPDIVCAHIETPTQQSQLGAKGVGEAGTAGAPGAVMNAINDALAPLGARVTQMPFTPERILAALARSLGERQPDRRRSEVPTPWARSRRLAKRARLPDDQDVGEPLRAIVVDRLALSRIELVEERHGAGGVRRPRQHQLRVVVRRQRVIAAGLVHDPAGASLPHHLASREKPRQVFACVRLVVCPFQPSRCFGSSGLAR
jgi:hypothetical protein